MIACTLDALAVNATSGDVTVQDARLLDRELNDTIECEVLFNFAFTLVHCGQRNIFDRLNTTPKLLHVSELVGKLTTCEFSLTCISTRVTVVAGLRRGESDSRGVDE